MNTTPEKNRDWIGTWFVLAQERGFQTEIVLGSKSFSAERDKILWQKYSHAQYDGVGLALDYFRNLGLAPTVPKLAPQYRANLFQRGLGIIRNLRFIPVKGAKWRRFADEKVADKSYGEYVYKILSRAETAAVLRAAKVRSVTASAHLLWALNDVIKSEIVEGSGPFYWMVPVNMRGAVKRPIDTSNQQSWVWVDALRAASPVDIQAQIQTRFRESFHWGAWSVLNAGRWIGLKGMAWVLDQAENVKENWVGTFSNLGAWDVPADPVVFVVPIAPTTPLSVGCITVNGQMALSLHVHPALNVTPIELEEWLQHWLQLIAK